MLEQLHKADVTRLFLKSISCLPIDKSCNFLEFCTSFGKIQTSHTRIL